MSAPVELLREWFNGEAERPGLTERTGAFLAELERPREDGFAPVFLDEPLNNTASMTFLRHTNMCPRSGFLYRKHRKDPRQAVNMLRGSALHAFHERATKAIIEAEEQTIPPELAKAILAEVLREYPVPLEEHDYCREYAYRWAGEFVLRPDERVVSVERMFVLELGGWTLRCKVDLAMADELNRLYIADWKSGRGAPANDEITRRRPDGTLAAKAFQLVVYVLAVVFGRPAELCRTCSVPGAVVLWEERGDPRCGTCGAEGDMLGRSWVAGEQVARGCEEAIAEYVFPGIEDSEGRILRRPAGLTRLEMLEYRESLQLLLEQVGERERSGDWPAVVSDAACDECPCKAECPIPVELRDLHGQINTVEEAREALARRHVTQARDRALGRELRAFMEQQLDGEEIRYGNRVAAIVPREATKVDREKLFEALADGMPLDEAREKFVKTSIGTQFAERDLKPDEFVNDKEDHDG